MDRTTADGKFAALDFLMPYVQRLPNRLLRSEWATRIASELRVDEPVLRAAFRRAADERRSKVQPKAELLSPPVKRAERQLIRMLFEAEEFREKLARRNRHDDLHRGLETAKSSNPYSSPLKTTKGRMPPRSAPRSTKKTAACSSKSSSNRPRSHLGRCLQLSGLPAQPPRGRRAGRPPKAARSEARSPTNSAESSRAAWNCSNCWQATRRQIARLRRALDCKNCRWHSNSRPLVDAPSPHVIYS